MATTSAELAATVLDCLVATGTPFAVLHGEEAVADGDCTSDVDLVTREPARVVVAQARDRLRDHGLHPVVVWPYDVGSASVFVVDAHAHHGAQFDILHDRSGAGRYGVRAGAVLADAHEGVRWRRAAPADELLYLVRKRQRKRQPDRLAGLLARAADLPADQLRDRADRLLSPTAAAAVTAALDGRPEPTDALGPVRAAAANSGRVAYRLVRPVGFWVAVGGAAARPTAEAIAARFGRVLPAAGAGPTPTGPRDTARRARRIAAVRWRAGVYASWGPRPRLPADLSVDAADGALEDVLAEVVQAMERKALR